MTEPTDTTTPAADADESTASPDENEASSSPGLDAASDTPAPSDDETVPGVPSAWGTIGRALGTGALVAGKAVARGAAWTGEKVADGWRAIDPDLRRHFGHAPLVGLTQVLPVDTTPTAKPDDGHRPAIFVHGLAGHPGNFSPMRAWFKTGGRSRTWALNIAAAPRIPAMAGELRAFIDALDAANGFGADTKYDLVAHSMGGLVSRYALLDPHIRDRVATLVTLGTPHDGTYAARYAATQKVLDLRPGSEPLTAIAAQLPWPGPPTHPRLVTFWSDADMLLLPPRSARVDGSRSIEMPGYTHLSYLLDPACFQRVWMALLDPPGDGEPSTRHRSHGFE